MLVTCYQGQIIDEKGQLKSIVKEYILFVSNLCNLECFDLNINLNEFSGQNIRIQLSEIQRKELINHNKIDGKNVFSYAFVRTVNRPEYLSYTIFD